MQARPPVTLIELTNGQALHIKEYDCELAQAERFASSFRTVWHRLPEGVRTVLDRHWTKNGFLVLLTLPPPSWGRQGGFASAKPDGAGVHCWSGVLQRTPVEHLLTDIAHELGHMTFIVIGEPGHKRPGYVKAEWLINELLPIWGYDQIASDEWKLRHMILADGDPRWIDPPMSDEDFAPIQQDYHAGRQRRTQDRADYRSQQQSYFDIATGASTPSAYGMPGHCGRHVD